MNEKYLFKNRLTNITYKQLETSNGTKVIHLINPHSTDFYISTVHKAGAIYDNLNNLPEGTAHMLEHLLIGNPNKILQTKKEIDDYEIGNSKQPYLSSNGQTTPKYMYFNVDTHHKGSLRAIRFINYALNSPFSFEKYLEKEKSIVIAERNAKIKREKDSFLKNIEFLFKEDTPEFVTNVLGEEKSIKQIKSEHLEIIYKNICNKNTSIITIQSPSELTKKELKELDLLTKDWSTEDIRESKEKKISNRFKVGVFQDLRESGINISFIYFKDITSKIDYKEELLDRAFNSLLWQISHNILREELRLIYGIRNFRNRGHTFGQETKGFILTTTKDNFEKTLEEVYKILNGKLEEYLNTSEGIDEFYSYISTYIYHKTIQYNKYLAEEIGPGILENDEIFNMNKLLEIAKDITIDDMRNHLAKTILNNPPHIWISSPESNKYIKDKIKTSKFHKSYTQP